MRELLEQAHHELDLDSDYCAARCEGCSKSVLQVPLYSVEVASGGIEAHPESLRHRSLCSDCAFSCTHCGRACGLVQPVDNHRGWLACAECSRAHYGLPCGTTYLDLRVPTGTDSELPPVLNPERHRPAHLEAL